MPKNSSAARREQARALAATENISYTAALRRLDTAQPAESTADNEPDAVVRKSKNAIRALADALGVPYSAAARRLGSARRAEATAVREEKRWRLVSPEEPDGRTLSWRVAVPLDDRDTFTDSAGRHLGSLGWDVVSWPAGLTGTVTIPVVRNLDGMQEDEATRLHKAAGVTYHSAHDAYVYAVADAVTAMGLKIGDVSADAGEPREGWFRIGGDRADFLQVDGDGDESGFGASTVVAWDEPDLVDHLPYLEAVADALEAAGLNAGRAEDSSDEWRSGFINIATSPDGDPDDDGEDHFVLCWDSQDGIRWIEYYTGPINSSPAVIAAAASDRLAGNGEDWSVDQPGWGHDPDDDDDHDAAFAAYLERDLVKFGEGRPGARS